jgi:hypothetical protein
MRQQLQWLPLVSKGKSSRVESDSLYVEPATDSIFLSTSTTFMHRLIQPCHLREREPAWKRQEILYSAKTFQACSSVTQRRILQQVQKDAIEIIADGTQYTDSFRNNRSMAVTEIPASRSI